MFEPRRYRKTMGGRFTSFVFRFEETDIWLGYDKNTGAEIASVKAYARERCILLRRMFESYFLQHPGFKDSLDPLHAGENAPQLIRDLAEASFTTQVGPMAGIAGAFAEEIGKSCKHKFGFEEIIVENGGDTYIDVRSEIRVSLFADNHSLSNKIQLMIPPEVCPMGLCASSGKFGHSKSFGSADLVSVAGSNAILADQYATYFANRTAVREDVQKVLDEAAVLKDILHISVFKDDVFGIGGRLKIKT